MTSLSDTIVAPITAAGGAVAVLRLSGPDSVKIAAALGTWRFDDSDWSKATYARYTTGDDGILTPFPEGHSYTGEETVEFSCHGSRSSIQALVELCASLGARLAEPGEFTYRAFMNGRMDLTQAEGVRDTVAAQTDAQLRQANLLREGSLRSSVQAVLDQVVTVLVAVEASTDFSEEIGELDHTKSTALIDLAIASIDDLLTRATLSQTIREGITVAIIGRPNVGKSSLLNSVTRSDRAIVTEIPGTTRDSLSELVSVNGIAVRLVDTAGLRETLDVVEQLGVQRSREILANAEHVWFVYDSSEGWTTEDQAELDAVSRPTTVIANKVDKPASENQRDNAIPVSAATGHGVASLLESLAQNLSRDLNGDLPVLNRRHAPLLAEARDSLYGVRQTFAMPVPDDLAAVGLRSAVRQLGQILGTTAEPDIIERVFHDFCIGK